MQGPAASGVPADLRPYLLPPGEGFPLALDAGTRALVDAAYRELVETGQAESARRLSAELLARDAALAPAQVLAAQVEVLEARYGPALERLLPLATQVPDYLAAELLRGRAAELLGDLPTAFEAYRQAAAASPLAARREGELRPRAVEVVYHRLEGALERLRVEDAGRELALLQTWAPADPLTLSGAFKVAAATGDQRRELAALVDLLRVEPGDVALRERRAELETEVGDAAVGLRLLQDLASERPQDAALAEKLARARFRWRLQLLPREAQQLARSPQLARSDFAVLVYWLFPAVRYGGTGNARIATDILDDPRKEQIIRVVNQGLMDVDPSLHRFDPGRTVTRKEVLQALLRVMAQGQPPASCVAGGGPGLLGRGGEICAAAVRCGLLAEAGECRPGAGASGEWAVEMSGVALDRLGSR